MTTKTYFMRTFNLILYLLLIAPICSMFGWLSNFLSVQLTNISWNYCQSVYRTFLLRHFLFQRERVQKISNLEHQTVTTINPIHNGFNRAVRKSIVDIRKDTIVVFLAVCKIKLEK